MLDAPKFELPSFEEYSRGRARVPSYRPARPPAPHLLIHAALVCAAAKPPPPKDGEYNSRLPSINPGNSRYDLSEGEKPFLETLVFRVTIVSAAHACTVCLHP